MNISEIAFRYKRVVVAMLLVMMVFGFASYFLLPTREDPKVTIREAVITTRYPSMPADRVEMLITKTIEEAIRSVPELEEIRSVSLTGRSIIHAEVQDRYFDLDQIWDDVRNEIERAADDLPEGTAKPIVDDTFGDVAVVTAALLADEGFDMGQMFDMAQHIRDVLYTVTGTKKIDLLGVQPERIYIEASNARLAQLGISPGELIALLQQQNIIRPGGAVDAAGREFIIQPTGNFESLEDIRTALIPLPGRQETIAVQDIATVRRGFVDPPVRTAYYNGEPGIVFAIAMTDDANVLDFAPRVQARIEELNGSLPAGYRLEIATNQAEQVRNAVYGVTASVLQTLAIVLVVVILFLGVRTGLIVGTIVPAVMLVTLAIMNFAGMSLERMSLATLVIALGLLVDNGIVIAEDFKRRIEDGESRRDALKHSGGTLAVPLLTSSLTTIFVFLPLMLADHISGEYTRSVSLVILITLLSSWVIAMTVTPVLCHRFMRLGRSEDKTARRLGSGRFFERLNRFYKRFLQGILRFRLLFLLAMAAIFAVSVLAMTQVPRKFFPDSDRSQVLVYLDMPAGTSMRKTDATLREIFTRLKDNERFPHIESFAGYGGFGGPRFVLSLTPIDPEDNKGFVVLNIDRREHLEETITTLRALFDESFPEVFARVTKMFLGPSDSSIIEIQVKGPDANYLYETAGKIENLLRKVPGTIDIKNDWENRIAQIRVDVDHLRAKRAGVTSEDIARSLATYFSGMPISEFREGDDIFPIVLRAEDSERFDLARLYTVSVYSRGRDINVPLMQVADLKLVNHFARIAREDLFRTVTVQAKNTRLAAESMIPLVEPDLNRLKSQLPAGYRIEYDGVIQMSGQAQRALSANLPLCLGFIVILMIAQFNSYRRALIIVMTVPLLVIGAVVGLLVMRADFGFMPTLGLYALAGIIINNAIVLIDRIDEERRTAADAFAAIVSACVRRLRPIVMTTVTTILGLMPLILARDPLFYGMASAIAFGLAIGTVLTLGVTPVLYSLFFRISPEPDRRAEGGAPNAP